MLHHRKVQRIQKLLQAGHLSQRQIAAQLGVHRRTVRAIAGGFQAPPEAVPPARCRRCGALVFMPCLGCQAS